MALPALTAEQRTAALAKAMAARSERAVLLKQLKQGEISLADVFERTDDATVRTPVLRLLLSLPGIGEVRARQLLTAHGISESRRIRGLGPQQRAHLLAEFPSQR